MRMYQANLEKALELAAELSVERAVTDVQHGIVTEGIHPTHGEIVIYAGCSGPCFYVVA